MITSTDTEVEIDPTSLKGSVLIQVSIEYIRGLHSGNRLIAITGLRRRLREDKYLVIEREIVRFAKELGFTVVYPHNKAHIKVESEQQLRDIAESAGFSDGFYDEIESMLTNANLG